MQHTLQHSLNRESAAPADVAHGSAEALREFIAEALDMARISAELGVTYAAIGDDTGLEYQVRRLVAYTRTALAVLGDLKAHKHGEAAHA